jgi:hypothetical protein
MAYYGEIDALDETRLIWGYLTPWSGEPRPVVSTLSAVLRDARGAALRDLDSGSPLNELHSTSWLATVGYMILLDQVGSTVRPRGVTPPGGSKRPSFLVALRLFASHLLEREAEALYALRCCLVHDYALAHRGRRRPHHFRLIANDSDPIVTLPKMPWDGRPQFPESTDETSTAVNIRKFADLVEATVANLRRLAATRDLEIALAGGKNELALCYFIQMSAI